jgi:hypothetical protein
MTSIPEQFDAGRSVEEIAAAQKDARWYIRGQLVQAGRLEGKGRSIWTMNDDDRRQAFYERAKAGAKATLMGKL